MNKFRDALYRFMYGRNGVDALNWALFAVELVLSLLSSFVRVQAVAATLYFLSVVLMFIVLIRIFSRNLTQRRADKAHKYVRCSCGAYCRVPKGVGKVELTCPKCGKKKVVKT